DSLWRQAMSDDKAVRIVVAGRTNSGKTTLIRTLIKASIGVVADRANVTQIAEAFQYKELEYNGMQAIFIDTPGFQNAGRLLSVLENQDENPKYRIPKAYDRSRLKFDEIASHTIQGSDVVLYVSSLESVPDDSHQDEIALIRRGQPRIVGILNKSRFVVHG